MNKKILLAFITILLGILIFGAISVSAATTNVYVYADILQLRSTHNYANNTDKTWIYTEYAELDAIEITFSEQTNVELNHDYIYILDANDNQLGKYTGTTLAGKTIRITGNKFKIRLTSDSSGTEYGFSVTGMNLIADGTVIASGTCGSKLTWKLQDNGVLTINGTGSMTNYTSASSAPWYNKKASISTLAIEEGVTTIGDNAFYNCYGIAHAEIPDSVTSIGTDAFEYCSNLVSLDIGSGLTTVKSTAFSSCSKLNWVNIKDLKAWCNISFENSLANPASVAGRLVVNGEETIELVIPEGVTTIKPYVFASLDFTEKIVFPKTLTSIDEYAFYNCSYIEEYAVNSANTVYSSADGVLFNKDKTALIKYPCAKAQTSYSIPSTVKTIEKAAFSSADFTSVTLPSSLETIKANAFEYCTKLTSITIPASVKIFGEYILYQCTALKTATISSGVTEIPYGLFYYCVSLTGVNIPTTVMSVGSYAFYHCEALTGLTLPDNITSIGSKAFYCCKALKSIKMPAKLTTLGDYCFNECTALTSISITSPLKRLEPYTFYKCTALKSVTLPDDLVYIGDHSFYGCTALTSVGLPAKLSEIDNYAFYGCSVLTNISLPANLTEIGYYCFYRCINLRTIVIPDNVPKIYQNTFYGCTSLTDVTFGKYLKEVHFNSFSNCPALKIVKIGPSITLIDDSVFAGCTALTDVEYAGTIAKWNSITIDPGNDYLTRATIKHTYTTTSANNVSVQYQYSYKASQGVTIVGFNASASCAITLPDSIEGYPVKIIGDSAFEDCDYLTSIVLPEGITCIGSSAFYNCSNLKYINISDEVTSIGSYAFAYCSSLENVRIPDLVTEISSYAFKNASKLKNIAIPSSVKRIGISAFDSIYDYDKTFNIFYTGTEDAWKKVSIDSFNNVITSAKNIYHNCITGTDGALLWVVSDKLIMVMGDEIPDYPNPQAVPWSSYARPIKTLKLQDNITKIGNYSFSLCDNLQYVLYYGTLADYSDILIGSNNKPLMNAKKYANIVATKYIEDDIFYVLDSNDVFTLAGTGEIPDYGFSSYQPYGEYRNTPTKVVIEEGITYLGGSAFAYFGNLTTVEIPDSVTAFGEWLFEGCTKLRTINIPKNVTTISRSMFLNCSALRELEIPRNLTTVDDYAFSGCTYFNLVHYNGTREEFGRIRVGVDNSSFVQANKDFYAYVTFRNTDGSLITSETQTMGEVINLDSVPFVYGYGTRLYKDPSFKESFSKKDIIAENLELYVEYFELPMNRILVNGNRSGVVGSETKAYDISFSTDKETTALYFIVKYPEYITLKSVIPKDFEYAQKEDEYNEDGYTISIILAQYSEVELIPQHEIITPFEMTFDISKTAIPGTVQIEATEESCLIGNEAYFFEERIAGDLEILPKLAEGIEISGADVISSATTYTVVVTPDYTTDQSVEWAVNDETIATVDQNGVVTPVTSGTVILTATTKDGSGISATKTIQVTRGITNIEIVGADSITGATTYTVIITPAYATNKEVEWTISNSAIATINQNGVVTPVASGTVTLTATAKDGSGVFATKEINIIKLAESIEISGDDSISSPAQYIATVLPDYASDKDVHWSVDNETIATVDELGIVTPVTSGHIVLTATAKDGSGVYATKTIEIVKIAESIEIIGAEEITEPSQYSVVILPEYTTNKNAQWSVSDETIAIVDENGVVTPLKNGKIVLTAKAEDASGIETTKSIVITVSVRANSITSNVGEWDKEFDPDVTEYTINVPDGTTDIYFTSSFKNATAKVNGSPAVNGVRKKVTLSGNETNVIIQLTPTTGNTLKANTYTINVIRGSFTKTTVSEDGKAFTVTPINMEQGKTVMLALYNGNQLVEMQPALYEGESLSFTTTKEYTNAKIMVWDDLTSLKSACNVEELN